MLNSKSNPLLMVVTVVAARTNRVSPALPVIVSDGLNGYLLGGDGQGPLCHWDLLVVPITLLVLALRSFALAICTSLSITSQPDSL